MNAPGRKPKERADMVQEPKKNIFFDRVFSLSDVNATKNMLKVYLKVIWIDNKPHCPFHFSRHGLHIASGMRSCELPLQGSFDHATLRESTLKIVTPIARVADMLKVVKHTATLISIQRSTPPPKAVY